MKAIYLAQLGKQPAFDATVRKQAILDIFYCTDNYNW
jgi:hypothetical protein